jgi:hypothetical protein
MAKFFMKAGFILFIAIAAHAVMQTLNQPSLVMNVNRVRAMFDGPEMVRIKVEGQVATAGWSYPRLRSYSYGELPPDGVWDFDFLAEPPPGPAAAVIRPIAATYVWKDWKAAGFKLRAVRIHAANNVVMQDVVEMQASDQPKPVWVNHVHAMFLGPETVRIEVQGEAPGTGWSYPRCSHIL